MSYAELLSHPKWQRRRLEIMALHDYQCQECASKDDQLHIHHVVYLRGKKPWEYPDHLLKCFCKDCHETAESLRNDLLVLAADYTLEQAGVLHAAFCDLSRYDDRSAAFDEWVNLARYLDDPEKLSTMVHR